MVGESDSDEEQAPESPKENGRRLARVPWITLVAAGTALLVIPVWLYLGFRIISGAIGDPGVLDNIEGLLTALAVLTIPTVKIIDKIYDKWLGE